MFNSKSVFMAKIQLYIVILMVYGCNSPGPDANDVVNKSIQFHGGTLYENSIIDFDFRNRHYTFERDHGLYKYHRIWKDSLGTYHDILTNDGFKRLLNDHEIKVTEDWARRYSSSINSVAYFALLPFGLNDPAVNKKYLGQEVVNKQNYHKIQVTFDKEGGGEDPDDVFVYWIHQKTLSMDYFGYAYQSDGGGIRFRKAIHQREVGGIRFADYLNFQGADDDKDVSGLAKLFEDEKLQKLSEINLENIQVESIK